MQKEFKISVVIPIYNVEEYIEEALDSVINQTLGFEENIQMVLVNDGSSDSSGEICERYEKKYPQNIKYFYKENGGVSSARNMGIDYAVGKYLTFLDPDDKWEEHSFKNAYEFFEKHYDEIDVLAARVKFFEANDNYHALDYKFDRGTRIADLDDEKEIFSVQSTTATTFMKRSAVGDTRFDTHLKFGEDSTFINKMMLKKKAYGLICEALYYYRRRASGTSAVNNQTKDKSFYTESLTNYHMELMNYSRKLYGEVIPYIQSLVAYDLYYRMGNDKYKDVLDEDEIKVFRQREKQLLDEIDDYILVESPRHKTMRKRDEAFELKYGHDLTSQLEFDETDKKLKYKGYPVLNVETTRGPACRVGFASIKDDKLIIDLFIAQWLFRADKGGKVTFSVNFGDVKVTPKLIAHDPSNVQVKENRPSYYYRCHLEFDISDVQTGEVRKFVPYIKFGDKGCRIALSYSKFVPNSNNFGPAYKVYGEYGLKCFRSNLQVLRPKRMSRFIKLNEKRCLKWLKLNGRKDLAKFRKDFFKFRKTEEKKGKIWLFSDRIDNAGDSGEVVFKYISKHAPEGVRPIFNIGRDARPEVIKRLKTLGEVVYYEDELFKFYFLMADKIISSSAGEFTINAMEKDRPYFIDLYNFDFYFMNHGVNCGDCSNWLNKFNKNIHIFFNTGVKERQAIIDGRYDYTEDQCVITGLPRFDALYEDTRKQLLILPSWRRSISGAYDEKTSSVYFDGFVETDYFKFYNGLINDERLLSKMREKGYKGLFCLHPIFMKQYVDFQNNDVFDVNEGFVDYNKVFAESAAMVTDYSTIAFDFAYLKKPIVYTQFDQKQFYEDQVYDKGFFEYETDGFGPVCYDLDSAVNELVELIDNDCKNKYIDRVENFFVNIDQNNSKRVLDAIIEDDKKRNK